MEMYFDDDDKSWSDFDVVTVWFMMALKALSSSQLHEVMLILVRM